MKAYLSLLLASLILSLTAMACSGHPASGAVKATPTHAGVITIVQATAGPNESTAKTPRAPVATSPELTPEISSTGDIPDTATYLEYKGPEYSLQYVEGWAQEKLPNDGIRFADKDSFVMVTLQNLPLFGTIMDYAAGQGQPDSANEFKQFVKTDIKASSLPSGPAALLTFKALSSPDPVTGKQVTLDIKRYFIQGTKYLAVLTEATPSGVDNVDAFNQIAQSFAWVGK